VHVLVQDDVDKEGIYGLRSGENEKGLINIRGCKNLVAFFLKKRLNQR
jgi:hypothetical protein